MTHFCKRQKANAAILFSDSACEIKHCEKRSI